MSHRIAASRDVANFTAARRVEMLSIDATHATLAIEAHRAFGRGRYPARLNIGDCFAYACAEANDAKRLSKGDAFARTDLA